MSVYQRLRPEQRKAPRDPLADIFHLRFGLVSEKNPSLTRRAHISGVLPIKTPGCATSRLALRTSISTHSLVQVLYNANVGQPPPVVSWGCVWVGVTEMGTAEDSTRQGPRIPPQDGPQYRHPYRPEPSYPFPLSGFSENTNKRLHDMNQPRTCLGQ